MMIAILTALKWILIIIGILLAVLVIIVTSALWSVVTIDAAANSHKAILTVSIWRFIKRTFEIPFDKLADKASKEAAKDADEQIEAEEESQNSKFKDFLGTSVSEGELKADLKSLWDSENYIFDFQALHDLIIKYAAVISDYKYGLSRVFRHLRYKIRLDRLDIYIRYGTGEPDKTGMAYGAMYAGAGSLTPLIKKYIKTENGPRLFLDPNYVTRMFDYEVGAVVKTRLAYFLNAMIIGFVSYKLRKTKRSNL